MEPLGCRRLSPGWRDGCGCTQPAETRRHCRLRKPLPPSPPFPFFFQCPRDPRALGFLRLPDAPCEPALPCKLPPACTVAGASGLAGRSGGISAWSCLAAGRCPSVSDLLLPAGGPATAVCVGGGVVEVGSVVRSVASALRTQGPDRVASADPGARKAPRRGRGFRQDHQLEQAAQGGPGDHQGALVTAPRLGPAVRCRGIASWRGRASHST